LRTPDEAGRAARQGDDWRRIGDGSGDLGRGRRGHHRGFAGARRAVWAGLNAELVDQPVTHLSVGIERFSLAAASVLASISCPARRSSSGSLDRRHKFTEEVRVPPACNAASLRSSGRITFRLKGARASLIHGVKRRERLPTPQAERTVKEAVASAGSTAARACDAMSEAVDVHG
jgi:hypothetical protein